MATTKKRSLVADFFGTLGYFSALLQWLWALLILGYPLIADPSIFFPKPEASPQFTIPQFSLPGPVALGISIAITAAMLVLMVVIIYTTPRTVRNAGQKITHQTAETLVPIMLKNKPVSKKQRRVLTARFVIGSKALLVAVPFLATFFSPSSAPLAYPIVVAVAAVCFVGSIMYFLLQYGAAWVVKVDLSLVK